MRKIKKLLNLLCIVYELFTIIKHIPQPEIYDINILVNVYVDLVIFSVLPVLHRPEVVDIGVNTV